MPIAPRHWRRRVSPNRCSSPLRNPFHFKPSQKQAKTPPRRSLVATTGDDTIAAIDTMTTVHASRKLSAEVVAALMAGKDLPEAELGRLFAEEREVLARDATVTAFLEIFVLRNVQQRLRIARMHWRTPASK